MIRTRVLSTHRDPAAALQACAHQRERDPGGVYVVRLVRRRPNKFRQFLRAALVRVIETSQ